MANNKTQNKQPAKEQNRANSPLVTVRIDRMVEKENVKIKAIASANIGGAFAIHGIRVIDSQNGLFVQMPQESYQKDGKTEYKDIFHPITTSSRSELYNAVLAAYEQRVHMREDEQQDESPSEENEEPDEDQDEDEDIGFTQSM